MTDLIEHLRDYQLWMKDGQDRHGDVGPSIGIDDIDGDETFGAAADALATKAAATVNRKETT